MQIHLKVNGKEYSADVEPRLVLLDYIRENLGLTGTKRGCESGDCGACTILLNGRAVKSCMMLAVQADECEITTIEGISNGEVMHPVQQAFWENFAVQNGYVTPGIIMSVIDLLSRNPDPTETEVRKWLSGNLSRISGYQNIVKAVLAATAKISGKSTDVKTEEAIPSEKMIGSSIKTKEAPALLKGEAQFIDDIHLPEMLHVAILRSKYGHAIIKNIDVSEAEKLPGVVKVFTGKDTAQLMPLPVVWVPQDIESHFPPHPSGIVPGSMPVLAGDRVRFVGEQVAAVVATSRQLAYDALDSIKVDYEPLPVVIDAEEALKPGSPQLHEAVPNNLVMHGTYGNKEEVDKAIESSEVVVKQRIHNQRMIPNTIETRGTIASYDANSGDYTLWASIQPLYPIRLLISAYVLGIPYNKLHVIAPNFGGSQGSKGYLYADAPLLLFISKVLGKPVKWIDTREGHAKSTAQGRDQVQYATIAGTKDGKITALSCSAFSNIGAYPVINAPGQPRTLIGRSIPGAYNIKNLFYEVSVVFTNTVQVGPMRGSGRSEATFLTERMIEKYAKKIGMDPAEVRRINMVKPDQFPFDNGLGWIYDSGDYPKALDIALEKIDYKNISHKKEEAKKRGKLLGVGIGSYVAVAGVGRSQKMGKEGLVSGTWGCANIRIQPTGEILVTTGAQPHGQSQETTFAQVVAQSLEVPFEMIRVLHSDTNGGLYYGQGSYGSRSMSVEGSAVYKAAGMIKEKAMKFAAHTFKVPMEALTYKDAKVFITQAPQACMTLQQLAFTLWLAWDLPEGMDPGLEVTAYFDPPEFNFPYGTHIAIVEVDEKTGHTDLVKYVSVDDFGNVVNPKVVEGQTHGNIALGAGQALLEYVIYNKDGQILSDSFSTYAIPKATMFPQFETYNTITPSSTNPLGAKGAGDVSNPPVAPAIINALCNALSGYGIDHIEMPATPEKVWKLMNNKN